MTLYTGQLGSIKVGANSAAEVKNFTVDASAAVQNGTAMGDTWERNIAMQKSWSGKAQFNLDSTPSAGGVQASLVVGATIALKLYPTDAGGAGDITELLGNGIITKRSISTDYAGIAMLDVEFTGNGALTENTL